MSLPRRILAVCLIGAVATIGFSAYAFTASNTVPNSSAGDGTSVVSGYTVTSLAYGLNAATPTNIDSVSFTIAPIAAGTVKAKTQQYLVLVCERVRSSHVRNNCATA